MPLPPLKPLAPLLAKIRQLQPNAIRVVEEGGVVVLGVLRVALYRRGVDAASVQGCAGAAHVVFRTDPQAEVMQARRVVVVRGGAAGRAQDEAEVAVGVVDVRLVAESKLAFAKAEHLDQQGVVEGFGYGQRTDGEVDVLEAEDVDR